MHNAYHQRAITIALFSLTLVGLFLIAWSAWQLRYSMFVGATWNRSTGVVFEVDPAGPVAGQLRPGDRITAIRTHDDATPAPSVAGTVATAQLEVVRDGMARLVSVPQLDPPWILVLSRQIPPLVAFTFWGIGVIVLAFKPTGMQSRLFVLFCYTFALALVTGALGANHLPYSWSDRLFHILLWWVGPLVIHFHLYFPAVTSQAASNRSVLVLLYAIAVLGSIPNILEDPLILRATTPQLYSLSLLWLAMCLVSVVFLLARSYRRANTPELRRQIGLVATGASVALFPFFMLLLLPFVLLRRPLVPVEVTFLLLLFIPLTYGYAIINYRLIRLDRYVSRSAAFMLVITLLAVAYLLINAVLARIMPTDVWVGQVADVVVTLLLAALFSVCYRRLQVRVNYMLYGGSYDYRSAVERVSQALDQPADRSSLAQTLCEGVQTAMQLECVRLLLPNQAKALVLTGQTCRSRDEMLGGVYLSPSSFLYRYFLDQAQPIDGVDLQKLTTQWPLSASERQLLADDHARLWIPLTRGDQLIGLCILGNKRGSETFDVNDIDILQMVTRLANTAIQNTQLIDELCQRATESEQLHQQFLRAREEERKRVAREMHDEVIQSLVGLNYQLSNIRACPQLNIAEQIGELQHNVYQMLDDVRRICADLRPPALDSLGLVPAVRSHLNDLERHTMLEIDFEVTNNLQRKLPEDIALCLYRVMQEALVNIQKHADARQVKVGIDIQQNEVSLLVLDDGKGFQVPQQLGHLVTERHFGLVGLRERLEAVHGTLSVKSQVGQGTCILAQVPLPARHELGKEHVL